ncbi:hypothetical protein MT325_M693R [Paramecium bursaria chlorella virus MT325]|uniref:Uncharacterized protein M693R n=1 Tax=Paramecium bursaria Chlorella virus MT325 TaxID=346932 RepID=A7IV73_PBCVM|nr:hypothetical protein MT325_M693R [Paramecium bursaria chlorella virus MT325]
MSFWKSFKIVTKLSRMTSFSRNGVYSGDFQKKLLTNSVNMCIFLSYASRFSTIRSFSFFNLSLARSLV